MSCTDCEDGFCHDQNGLSPNALSSPIRIPSTKRPQQIPTPLILRNGDSTPGVVHVPRPNIVDYAPFHYSKTAEPKVFAYTNSVRLGSRAPQGFMAKPPAKKDVTTVPDHLPWRENTRELNRCLWERTQVLEYKKKQGWARNTMQRKMDIEARGKGESERDWNEGRSDSAMEVAISFV